MTTDLPDKECEHDYKNPIRKGRAHYVCKLCGKDLTLELVLMLQTLPDNNESK